MPRKINSCRVWQNKNSNIQKQQNPSSNEQNEELQRNEQNNSSQSSSQEDKIPEKHDKKEVQMQKYQIQKQNSFGTQNKQEQYTHFKVTSELLNLLNQKVYKEIVLSEFIQTNLNPEILGKLNSQKLGKSEIQNQSFKVRSQQIQRISDFIFGESLQLPPYLRPFRRNKCLQSANNAIEKPNIDFSSRPWKKRQALSHFNATLLGLSSIKYLNIYGPTGSGKTFTLKSIITDTNFMENIIWINGMNIISGKTKRFISDLKEKFDKTVWEFYQDQSLKQGFCQQNFMVSCFSKRSEKVLILDEYDQVKDFELADLLRYAYIKGSEKSMPNKRKLYRISKVIFVSNSFESTEEFMDKQKNIHPRHLASLQILYMQHLIFKPFTQKQAQSILLQKISTVNRKFVNTLDHEDDIRQMFAGQVKGIFQDQQLMHIIKKISISQQIDIRKILHFYVDSLKKRIQSLSEFNPNTQESFIKKVQSFFVDRKFLQNQSSLILISNKSNFQSQEDSNPLLFYLSQIEYEGRNILKAIYETLKFKKKLLDIQTMNSVKQKHKYQPKFEIKAISMLASQKRRQNTVRIMDFFGKIRPKIQLYKVYPWLYEWQEMGLIKIRKGNAERAFEAQVGIEQTNKIKISDNLLIEVLDKAAIQEGLDLFY